MASNLYLSNEAENGQIVADANGNIWIYNSSTRSWISQGVIADPPVVTETSSGLVTPEIYSNLQQIREAIADGVNFDRFKIQPAIDSYWYLLRSSNNTIRISPESDTQIRFEVNKAKIIQMLSKVICVGDRGSTGRVGLPGLDGKPGKPEATHTPVINGRSMLIDAEVATPLETDISLRLFKDGSQEYSAEVIVSFLAQDGEHTLTVVSDEIKLGDGSNLKLSDGKITGELILDGFTWGFLGSWTYKVSQKGRNGERGDPGYDFWQLVGKDFVDDNLRATKAIVSLRQGGDSTFYYWSEDLFKKVCVSRVGSPVANVCDITSLNPFGKPTNLPTIGDKRRDGSVVWDRVTFVSVEQTINECKDIQTYKYNPLDLDIEQLILPSWVPTTACYTPRLWSRSGFKWWLTATSGSKEDVDWVDCFGNAKEPTYPWEVITPKQPDEACCQQDFFWCPNVNDAPCAVDGTVFPPQPPFPLNPPSSSECCECDCPILSEVTTGGYDFETVTVFSDGGIGDANGKLDETLREQCVSCDISGNTQKYRFKVKSLEDIDSLVVIARIRLDKSVCPDRPNIVLSPGNDPSNPALVPGTNCGPPATLEDCVPQWRIVASDGGMSEPVQVRSFPTAFPDDSSNIDDTVSAARFIYQPLPSGEIAFDIDVNLNKLWCCLGYELCVSVNSEGGGEGSCGMFVTVYNNVTNIPYAAEDEVPPNAIIGFTTSSSPVSMGGIHGPSCAPNCAQVPPWNGVPSDEHLENGIAFIDISLDLLRQPEDYSLSDLEVAIKYRSQIYNGYSIQNLGPFINSSFLNVPTIGARTGFNIPSNVVPEWSDPNTIFWIREVVDNPLNCQNLVEILGDPNHNNDYYYLRDLSCGVSGVPVTNMIDPIAASSYNIESRVLDVGKNYIILVHDCVVPPPPPPPPSSPPPSSPPPPSISPTPPPSISPTPSPIDPSASTSPSASSSASPSISVQPSVSVPCSTYTDHTVYKSARALQSVKNSTTMPCDVAQSYGLQTTPCVGSELVTVFTPDDYGWDIPSQNACFAADGVSAVLNNSHNGRWLPPILRATNFGFEIPSDAILKSMSFRYRCRVQAAGSNVSNLIGVDLGPVFVSGGKRLEILPGPGNFTVDWQYTPSLVGSLFKNNDFPYDGSIFPNGPPWSISEINAETFGLDINISGYTTPVNIHVDHVEIAVKYSVCSVSIAAASWEASLLNKLK